MYFNFSAGANSSFLVKLRSDSRFKKGKNKCTCNTVQKAMQFVDGPMYNVLHVDQGSLIRALGFELTPLCMDCRRDGISRYTKT